MCLEALYKVKRVWGFYGVGVLGLFFFNIDF